VASELQGIEALDEAVVEFRYEADYYLAHGGPSIRDGFLDDFAQTAQRIVEAPRSFPMWPLRPGVRRALLERYPFAVGFVVGAEGRSEPPLVVVLAHTKRRPGYWLGRVKPPGR
jgi:toxin ParE1/3/4